MQKNNLLNKTGFLQILCISLFFISCLVFCSFPRTSDAKTINIGIVKDGDSPFFDARIKGVIQELELLAGAGNRIKIRELPKFNAQWNIKKIPAALKSALNDPGIDIIYAAGFLVTETAAKKEFKLKKPVVAGVIHDGRFMGIIHDKNCRSKKRNLTYIDIAGSIRDDINAFCNLTGFKTLHILVDEKIVQGSVHAADYIKSIEKEKNIKIKIILAGTSAVSVINQLDKEVEAVYITPLLRMSPDEAATVVKRINLMKIPSFSLLGRPAVESGVLAGRLPETKERMCRRTALNIHQIIMGESPNNLNVTMSLPAGLLINIETAHKIDFSPDFVFLISEAELIGNRPEPSGSSLTLEQAMEMASETNIDLAIQKELVESSLQVSEKAGTYLRPHVYGNGQYLQIDGDRAESSMGSAPERKITIGAVIRQIIFNDRVFTGIKTGRLKYEESFVKQESVKLDAVERTGKRFLQCLSANALYRIERDNLTLTQKNLNLAKVRQEVGYSGPEEVLRWEAEEAHRRSAVISTRQSVDMAFVSLNQSLGRDQDVRWNLRDIGQNIKIDQTHSYFLKDTFHNIVSNMRDMDRFRRFSVDLAKENAPEIAMIEKQEQALELVLTQIKRRHYMPDISAGAAYTYNLDKSGKGAETDLNIPGIDLPGSPDDHEWSVSLDISLPLYEGGARSADVKKIRADIKVLKNTKIRINQLIEQRTRSAVLNLSRSWPNIFLSKKAADRAGKNLELVQAMYSRGKVTITALIDAQNNKLIQEQNSALAVYKYLNDLVEFQRAVAWFEYAKTPEQVDKMLERIREQIEKR